MEDFRGEISTEEAPGAAVRRRIDVVLIAAGNFVDSVRNGATGKYGGILDQGLVGEGAAGHEDGEAVANRKGDDGAMLGM